MSKKLGIAAIILCIIALGISIAALTMASGQANNQEQPQDIQYVMYLGTNDKDTNEPVYPPKEAKTKAEDILLDYFGADIRSRKPAAAGSMTIRCIGNIPSRST